MFIIDNFLKEQRVTEHISVKNILWCNKPLMEDSILLWDLENISFKRLDDIKKVAKYTPQELYIVTKQDLGEKLLNKIYRENFKVLNAHKGISDNKIISIMKLYRNKKHMMLVSSDSDFAREANNYLKKGRLQWIVVDNVKKGVMMRVNLASSNLTLSSLAHKPSKKSTRSQNTNKKREKVMLQNKAVEDQKTDNQVSLYINYYKEKVKKGIKRVKKLYKKMRYQLKKLFIKDEIETIENMEVPKPINEKRDIYRRNFRGKRVRAGTLELRKDKKNILLLNTNLFRTYEMPPFPRNILFFKFEEIEKFIHFDSKEKEYYLNEFVRKSDKYEVI